MYDIEQITVHRGEIHGRSFWQDVIVEATDRMAGITLEFEELGTGLSEIFVTGLMHRSPFRRARKLSPLQLLGLCQRDAV